MKQEFFRKLWGLTRPYWRSSDRWYGIGLLGLTVALNLSLVAMSVALNSWNARFFNALQEYNLDAFVKQMWVFCGIATVYITVAIYNYVIQTRLTIRWRNWLTRYYLDRYLAHHSYYRMQLVSSVNRAVDNPDQRIATDVAQFVGETLSLGLNMLNAVVTLVSFTVILWGLSGALNLTLPGFLGGGSVVIHGYLLWIAIIYAGIGTWVIFKIGRPLIGLSYRTEAAEAGLRYSLIRLREQGEGVALYHGEKAEQVGLQSRLAEVITMMRQVLHRRKIIIGVRSTYGQIATIFPFLVIAPRYFSKEITLGTMTQTAGAFGSVQDSLSVLIDSYASIAAWRATIDRLHDFNLGLSDAEATAGSYREHQHRSTALAGSSLVLELSELEIFLPDGRLVQTVPNLRLSRGDSLLITGSSGSGKTTLLRVLSGVWPYWRGRIVMGGEVTERLFLPQRPYLPEGSLAAALAYPRPFELLTVAEQAEFAAALELTGLAGLGSRLAEIGQWSQSLSPGEQQRLAVARLLLLRPGLAFLDEATSALDEAMETRLYQQIRQTLPEVSLVSVGHRASLTRFHNQTLHIVPALDRVTPL